MSIDLNGTAAIISAVFLGLAALAGPAVNAWLQIKAARTAEQNKTEAIAARAAQSDQIAAVHTLVNNHSELQEQKIDSLTQQLTQSKSDLAIAQDTSPMKAP